MIKMKQLEGKKKKMMSKIIIFLLKIHFFFNFKSQNLKPESKTSEIHEGDDEKALKRSGIRSRKL